MCRAVAKVVQVVQVVQVSYNEVFTLHVPFVGRHFPGAIPGLLKDNTSNVSNSNITFDFPVALVSQATILQ